MRAGQGSDADVVWDRALSIVYADDNDATYVDVVKILSGSGILVAVGYATSNNTETIQTKIIIDGVTETTAADKSIGAEIRVQVIPIMRKYSNDMWVAMRGSGATITKYTVVYLAD